MYKRKYQGTVYHLFKESIPNSPLEKNPSYYDKKNIVRHVYFRKPLEKSYYGSPNNDIDISDENVQSIRASMNNILDSEEKRSRAIQYVINKRSDALRYKIPLREPEKEENPISYRKYYNESRNVKKPLEKEENKQLGKSALFLLRQQKQNDVKIDNTRDSISKEKYISFNEDDKDDSNNLAASVYLKAIKARHEKNKSSSNLNNDYEYRNNTAEKIIKKNNYEPVMYQNYSKYYRTMAHNPKMNSENLENYIDNNRNINTSGEFLQSANQRKRVIKSYYGDKKNIVENNYYINQNVYKIEKMSYIYIPNDKNILEKYAKYKNKINESKSFNLKNVIFSRNERFNIINYNKDNKPYRKIKINKNDRKKESFSLNFFGIKKGFTFNFKKEQELIDYIYNKYNDSEILNLFKIKNNNEKYKKKINELELSIKSNNKKILDLDKENKSLEEKLLLNENENLSMKKELKKLKNEKQKKDISELHEQYDIILDENKFLQEQNDKLQEKLDQLDENQTKELEELKNENQNLNEEKKKLINENEKLEFEINELNNDLEKLEEEHKKLSEKNAELEKNNKSYEKKNKSLSDENVKLKNENEKLSKDLEKTKKINDSQENKKKPLADKNEKLKIENEKLLKDYEKLKDDDEKLLNDFNKLKDEDIKLLKDYKKLKTENEDLLQNHKKLLKDDELLKNNFEKLLQNYETLKTENEYLLQDLIAVQIDNEFIQKEQKEKDTSKKEENKILSKTIKLQPNIKKSIISDINNNKINTINQIKSNEEDNNKNKSNLENNNKNIDNKNEKMNKALLRFKKKQQLDKEKSEPQTTSKISNLAKELENVLQGRKSGGEKTTKIETDATQNEDLTKIIENQTMSHDIKKKKAKKVFVDNE